jgi:hypothetical protein
MNELTIAKTSRTQATRYHAEQFKKKVVKGIHLADGELGTTKIYYVIELYGIVLGARLGSRGHGLFLSVQMHSTFHFNRIEHEGYYKTNWSWNDFTRYAENLLRRALYVWEERQLTSPLLYHLTPRLETLRRASHETKMSFLEEADKLGYDPGIIIWDDTVYYLSRRKLEQLIIIADKHLP